MIQDSCWLLKCMTTFARDLEHECIDINVLSFLLWNLLAVDRFFYFEKEIHELVTKNFLLDSCMSWSLTFIPSLRCISLKTVYQFLLLSTVDLLFKNKWMIEINFLIFNICPWFMYGFCCSKLPHLQFSCLYKFIIWYPSFKNGKLFLYLSEF